MKWKEEKRKPLSETETETPHNLDPVSMESRVQNLNLPKFSQITETTMNVAPKLKNHKA